MKKGLLFLALLLLVLPLAIAANLEVKTLEKDNVIIIESGKNATFTLEITNLEEKSDSFRIYSLVGITIFPKEFFSIGSGETKTINIIASPHKEIKESIRGFYVFEYQIKGQETGFYTNRLTINLIELKDAIEVIPENAKVDEENINIKIKNTEKTKIEGVKIEIDSLFFEFAETVSFKPEEEKTFTVQITKEKIKKLSAGEYEIEVNFDYKEQKSSKTAKLNYLEKGGISISESYEGLVIRKILLSKTNEGNINSEAEIKVQKNVLTRLFTTYSKSPDSFERRGLVVEYSWKKELLPGEEFSITANTNYTIPLIILIVLIIAIFGARFLFAGDLNIQKRVSLVRTKGGEFAMKVKLRIKSKKHLEEIKITDRIPRITKLYNKFGSKPDKVDPKTRSISWEIKKLSSGEERLFTYIIYSKVNIIGRLELPKATASYKKDGKHEHVQSNKTYFAAETYESS